MVSEGGTGWERTNAVTVDFTTGQTLPNFQPPNETAVGEALAAYAAQLNKYPSLQQSFNTTYPLAPDLLLPFGKFVQKYNLGAMMYTLFLVNQGYSPLLNLTTIYVFKQLNDQVLSGLENGFLTTPNSDTHALYVAALKFLGSSNVLLQSTVVEMDRSKTPIKLCVSTPSGRKLIIAKRLVSAIPPMVSNLGGYDLSTTERSLFSQFFANGYYTGLINNTGVVSQTVRLQGAAPRNQYAIPSEPGIYVLYEAPNTTLTHVYFGSAQILSASEAKLRIDADINRYRLVHKIRPQKDDYAIFSSHAPFNLQVSVDALKNGFYKKLYALNGQQNTFWTGAAFQTQASDALWNYSEQYILPIVLGSLSH
jgi:hypothetical protein